ncbi:MAG: hypothetical protein NXI27_19195 [Alphaproteobacteria bacterium]|nr:hypothetical protein [Alphaproteobacteria bacterium]
MADQSAPIEDGCFDRNNAKLSLSVEHPDHLVQIGFWPQSAAKVHKAVATRFKSKKTMPPGQFVSKGEALCIRSAFDAYLLINVDPVAARGDLSPDACAVTDLSHSRAAIAIVGPAVERFLNCDIAIDFSLEACPVGSAVQTSMHHIPVLLLRHAPERFVLYVYRSYARDLAGWMADMASPFQAG